MIFENIFDKYKKTIQEKISSKEVFFFPYKKDCLILYNLRYMDFYDFSVIHFRSVKKDNPFFEYEIIFEVSSLNNFLYCWYFDKDMFVWSKDSRYFVISAAVKNEQETEWFMGGRLVLDLVDRKFTIIPLAFVSEYSNGFLLNSKIEFSGEYIKIKDKTRDLNMFKWLPMESLNKISDLYYGGYFGNIFAGYKDTSQDNIKPAWPYDDKNTNDK
jgi:hypothetical protein